MSRRSWSARCPSICGLFPSAPSPRRPSILCDRLESALGSDAAVVVGDSVRLQQTLANLLTNALKFTPAGGRIEVRLGRVDTGVKLEVQDTGQGIAPELLPRVFERFRQAEVSLTRSQGGLGLGLAIAKHLVDSTVARSARRAQVSGRRPRSS